MACACDGLYGALRRQFFFWVGGRARGPCRYREADGALNPPSIEVGMRARRADLR